MALTPAVFLDKDGTLLRDIPYNVDPRRMQFAPGAFEGLVKLATLDLPLIVISNQAGVALGKFAPDDLFVVHRQLQAMFREAGATLAGFYCCPHHPSGIRAAYSMTCSCRKPAPGLFHLAAARHEIDLNSSWFVGDILDDVEAGRRAGCHTLLLDNGNETEWLRNEWRIPERTEPDLEGASRWIVKHYLEQDAKVRQLHRLAHARPKGNRAHAGRAAP